MSDPIRVVEFLEEALDSGGTPQQVSTDNPGLLPAARQLEDQLAAFFPSAGLPRGFEDRCGPARASGSSRPPERGELLPSVEGYAVEAVLGRGGAGVVYRAVHLQLRRPVALKMLLSGTIAGHVERARFQREARAIAALRHVHVVQVHDIGDHDGVPYFTMELMDGGSLAERLGGAPQAPAEAAELVATIARAVEAAHQAGIVHRDLKPANILLAVDGTPKVSDFGLARQAGDDDDAGLTVSGARVGTPSYMAPEQAVGRRGAIGPAVDVYALGAILYEALTGRPPFRAESAAETERQAINEEPASPSRLNARVPRDLETVCLKCLAKDPGKRYGSAAALAEDLGRFVRGEPVTARRTGVVARTAKWVRRRPAVAALWAIGATVMLALSAGAMWHASESSATARAVVGDLREAGRLQRESRWVEASAALDRAAFRLGNHGPAELRARLDEARRAADLVPRLETIRTLRVTRITGMEANRAYADLFREAGFGDDGADPGVVAARLGGSAVRPALVAALYEWMRCMRDGGSRERWLREVVRQADPDPTGWRDRALDPATWRDPTAAASVVSEPGLGSRSVELLLVVHGRLKNTGRNSIPFLARVQQAHPGDFWANLELCGVMREAKDYAEAIRYGQAAVALHPQAAVAHEYLGNALGDAGRLDESIVELREAARIDPAASHTRINLGSRLAAAGRHEEAVHEFEASLAGPTVDFVALSKLGSSLEALGQLDEALRRYDQAVRGYRDFIAKGVYYVPEEARQAYATAQGQLRSALIRQGRSSEVLRAWRAELDLPTRREDLDWAGYAECCLFCGDADEYRRACQALLERLGDSEDPRECERAGRACLLLPHGEAALNRATALIDRALATEKVRRTWLYPYFRVAKGLAEYRAGRYEPAIAIMERDTAGALEPMPQLVVAMCRWQLGQPAEARRALARAAVSFDWAPRAAGGASAADAWMYHVLRREAEAMILPELPAFLEGRYQPRERDERLAMTAACQFRELHAAHARLWTDALHAEPSLVIRGRRYAVRAAALAGYGRGRDAGGLSAEERASLRKQARDWMQQELAGVNAALNLGSAVQASLRATLADWSTSPDMASVRDEAALAALPATERAEWATLWPQVHASLKRVRMFR